MRRPHGRLPLPAKQYNSWLHCFIKKQSHGNWWMLSVMRTCSLFRQSVVCLFKKKKKLLKCSTQIPHAHFKCPESSCLSSVKKREERSKAAARFSARAACGVSGSTGQSCGHTVSLLLLSLAWSLCSRWCVISFWTKNLLERGLRELRARTRKTLLWKTLGISWW